MAGEKFYLIFSEEPNKRIRINEPVGYGEVDFNLDQREGKMGRDVSLSGGSINFRFTLHRHGKEFEKILYYAHRYGFEAKVKLIIVLHDGTEYIGELDFMTAESNDFNYFQCPIVVQSETQVFRRRSETKVDLFSSVDINGEFIPPLVPVNMLLKSKPSFQVSKWEQTADLVQNFNSEGSAVTTWYQVNPVLNLIDSGIKDTYTYFQPFKKSRRDPFLNSDFQSLYAQTNLKNVTINIKNVNLSFETDVDNNGNGYVNLKLKIFKGAEWLDSEVRTIFSISKDENQSYSFTGDFLNINIGDLQRGNSLWIFWEFEVRQSTNVVIGAEPRFEVFSRINKGTTIDISAESTAYNSIVPCIHVVDALKQISKSIAGLDVYAPRYEFGGYLYGTVITNGNLLRNILDKPFYVSWDDIFDKSISPEVNADSEIQIDSRVFVGIEEDYYTNNECGFFPNTQFSRMLRKPNPFYCLNNFNFKYENYQSLKENTEPNSDSTIHGQSIFTPYNQNVESSRELSVKWIRDAILLDVQQRLSTAVSKDTATQDDDKIFAIDTVETENDEKFTESTALQHTYTNPVLSLRSNGEINFTVLGIKSGSSFKINYPDANSGNYNVLSVSNTEIQLQKVSSGSISAANDGVRLTNYTYEIKKEEIPLTNRTNQGFDSVLNLISPEKYSNLRYSVQRNIRNFYNNYLASVNLYWKDKVLKNTFYKNNGACETLYAGLRVTEKEDWIPTNPIVTPYMYEKVIFANVDFSRFIALQNQIRTRRGFIRTIDNNKRVLKLYPIKMSYENKTRQLTISGQEKFEPTFMTIVKQGGIITVNGETKLRKVTYDLAALERDNQVILFDLERQRLYNGVYWDKVSINGALPETKEILKNWLELLS